MARRMIDDTAREAVDKMAYDETNNTLEVGTNLSVDGTVTVAYDDEGKPIELDGGYADNDFNIETFTDFWTLTITDHVFKFASDGIYLDDVKITN